MPIFLLPELAGALLKLSKRLANWDRLGRIEEQLLRRARSAFLVRWFGTAIPEKNLNLLIHIDNIDALSQRYALAERSRQRNNSRLNLFAPLAGMVGVAAGLVFNPTGGTLIGTLMRMFDAGFSRDGFGAIFGEIMYRLFIEHGSMPFWVSVAGFVLLLAAPLALGAGLVAGLGGEPRVRAVYNLLGDVAMLLDAFLGFWRQLIGPVEQIRNPLVRSIVQLLHRIAALVFQVVGFAALLIVRLVPLLPSLVAQVRALIDLGSAVIDVVREIVAGVMDAALAPFAPRGGIGAVLLWVLAKISELPSKLVETIATFFSTAVTTVLDAFSGMRGLVMTFFGNLKARIVEMFEQTPLGQLLERITQLLKIMPVVNLAFGAMPGPPPPPPPPSSAWYNRLGRALKGAGKWVATEAADELYLGDILEGIDDVTAAAGRLAIPSFPDVSVPALPTMPSLPDTAALRAGISPTTEIDLSATRDALMEDARRRFGEMPLPDELRRMPRSAFAGERRRLEAMGRPVISERESQLRDMIYVAIGRVLPPAMRIHAPAVRSMFDELDHYINGAAAPDEHAPKLPQLDLADSGRLRPQVRMLTIRSNRGMPADLRAFQTMLVEALGQRQYYAPAAG